MRMHFVGILDGAGSVWSVRIPDLPGCFGAGATQDEAVADATEAAAEWLEHQRQRGVAIPAPRAIASVRHDPDAAFAPMDGEALVLVRIDETVPA